MLKRETRFFVLVAGVLCGLACSPSESAHDTSGANSSTANAGFAPLPASPTTFGMEFTVAAGAEDFKCTYITMPPTAGFIVGARHEYSVGSHHMTIFRTTLSSIPAGQASPVLGDCNAPTATYMSTVNGVVYGSAVPKGELTLPEGVGLRYSAGEIFLFKSHYLNASGKSIDAQVSVQFTTQAGPVRQSAGTLFFYDPFIDVPAGTKATASTRCPIPQDITMLTESSHYHARGVGYQAYLDPPSGPPATSPIYTSNDWASPLMANQTIHVAAGSHIRYYCDYDNTRGPQPYYQGQSADTNEMCMFVGLYYPAMTAADEECVNGDTYGTGTVSCTDALTCLGKCPPADAGVAGPPGPAAFNPCVQQCFAQSCPNASGPLIAVTKCIQASCQAPCATPGTACASCVSANCASQYNACSSAACGTVPAP